MIIPHLIHQLSSEHITCNNSCYTYDMVWRLYRICIVVFLTDIYRHIRFSLTNLMATSETFSFRFTSLSAVEDQQPFLFRNKGVVGKPRADCPLLVLCWPVLECDKYVHVYMCCSSSNTNHSQHNRDPTCWRWRLQVHLFLSPALLHLLHEVSECVGEKMWKLICSGSSIAIDCSFIWHLCSA